MNQEEELSRRQAAVKEFRARYASALRLQDPDDPTTKNLLEAYRGRLEEKGVKLNAEEVIMGIVLLESLLDVRGETSPEELEIGILTLILGFLAELDEKWSEKDRRFFVE